MKKLKEIIPRNEIRAAIFGTCVGLVLLVVGLVWFPLLQPHAPNDLLKAILLQGSVGIERALILMWVVLLVDAATKGEWAETIGENAYASAAVYIAIVYACVSGMQVLQ